jgi:CDP-glycerol glycerophosphotransferase (TagB/SpsB family)
VEVAPAFRFQHLWKERKYYVSNKDFNILVALPFNLVETYDIINIIKYLITQQNHEHRYWIKSHPASANIVKKQILDMPSDIVLLKEEAFSALIERSDVLVTAYSNTAIETVAKGIPVIIVGNRRGFTHNSIPETITEDIWQLCYTPQEIADAILFFQTRSPEKKKQYEEVGNKIREKFFKSVTREGVKEFLELE